MISSRIRRLVQQQWAGLIALFLVLTGGSAWALDGSNTVFSDDIVDKQVKTADIEAAAVTNGKLAPDAVNSAKIAGGGVTTDDLADAAVAQAKLGPDSVNSARSPTTRSRAPTSTSRPSQPSAAADRRAVT